MTWKHELAGGKEANTQDTSLEALIIIEITAVCFVELPSPPLEYGLFLLLRLSIGREGRADEPGLGLLLVDEVQGDGAAFWTHRSSLHVCETSVFLVFIDLL